MKKIFLCMFSAFAILTSANAYDAKASFTENVERFDSISVKIPSSIKLINGDEYKITVIAPNSQVLRIFRYSVENGQLLIDTKFSPSEKETYKIIITSPSETKIMPLNGLIIKENEV